MRHSLALLLAALAWATALAIATSKTDECVVGDGHVLAARGSQTRLLPDPRSPAGIHRAVASFAKDIEAARTLCDHAEFELSRIDGATLALPGKFNQAASTILGGSKFNTYTGNQEWVTQAREEGIDIEVTGVKDEEARITFMSGIAIMGTDEQQSIMDNIDRRSGAVKQHWEVLTFI